MLEVKRLSAGYGEGDVIHEISFTVDYGENLCILGENGCGKTTLLRAIAGLIPASGEALLDGSNLIGMKRGEIAARVAVLSQSAGAYFDYTVEETVMLGRYQHMRGRLLGGADEEDKAAVEEALEATGLSKLRRRSIMGLSGGQLQRVFLARTLAQQPKIIFLDEPTNHLDLRHQLGLIEYLKSWSKAGERAVVGVLHDINLARRLTDRALLMKEGRTLYLGSLAEAGPALLEEAYGVDVAGYMLDSLKKWEVYSDV